MSCTTVEFSVPKWGGGGVSAAAVAAEPDIIQRCFTFSADAALLAIGTTKGFQLFSTEPFSAICNRLVDDGSKGVERIAVFARCDLLLLAVSPHSTAAATAAVSGRASAAAGLSGSDDDPREVLLWSESSSLELVSSESGTAERRDVPGPVARRVFDAPVRAMRLHRHCAVIGTNTALYILDAGLTAQITLPLNWRSTYPTAAPLPPSRTSGAGAGRHASLMWSAVNVLAIPGAATCEGHPYPGVAVRVEGPHGTMGGETRAFPIAVAGLQYDPPNSVSFILVDFPRFRGDAPMGGRGATLRRVGVRRCEPHHQGVRCIAVSPNGARAATTSLGGTAVKLIDVATGVILAQFNRGQTHCVIHQLHFHSTSRFVAAFSETSVHVFFDADPQQGPSGATTVHSSGIGGALTRTFAKLQAQWDGIPACAVFPLGALMPSRRAAASADGEPTYDATAAFDCSGGALRDGYTQGGDGGSSECLLTLYVALGVEGKLGRVQVALPARYMGGRSSSGPEEDPTRRCKLDRTWQVPMPH